jgi:cellulose synthase/poly-beta-1,6-N-acetylglucosamine synthase-like glycosyltransferase
MNISIVISYYKNIPNLKLILLGLTHQADKKFDVILSEDDNSDETKAFLQNNKYPFEIIHIYQKEDLGFRKNKMLNRAISSSENDFLVFIDGDCIPGKHFVFEYQKNKASGYMYAGRRVMLGKKTSDEMIKMNSLNPLSPLSLLFSSSTKIKEAIYSPIPLTLKSKRGLLGCNWGIAKKDLVNVNGYDEDYINAGVGEDNDIEWRLQANGLKTKSMKNKAIVYHIYHPRTYSEEGVQKNFKIWARKKNQNHIKCLNGITKLTE